MITANLHQKPVQEPTKQLISRRELAERWSCCVETIKNRERAGILKPIRFGTKSWRYRMSDVLHLENMEGGMGQ
jgi:hypothetical protein